MTETRLAMAQTVIKNAANWVLLIPPVVDKDNISMNVDEYVDVDQGHSIAGGREPVLMFEPTNQERGQEIPPRTPLTTI